MSAQQPDVGDDGAVVLDIGGDVGALILLTPESLLGAEIEISPLDAQGGDIFQQEHPHDAGPGEPHEHGHGTGSHNHPHPHANRTHVMVRERRTPSGMLCAAVYPGLSAGIYQLWAVDGSAADVVRITGGQVAELDWR